MGDGIVDGTNSPTVVYYQLYSHWLLNGGDPDRFQDLTEDELNMMYITLTAESIRDRKSMIEGIARILGAKRA